MSAKPESTFIRGVHRHLPKTLYRLKNNNTYVGGIADCWYSGTRADLWVEYKFLPKIAKNNVAALSELQTQWLKSRHIEGRNVAVIVGSPQGGVILCNLEWEKPISSEKFHTELKSRSELATWIQSQVS